MNLHMISPIIIVNRNVLENHFGQCNGVIMTGLPTKEIDFDRHL